MTDQDPRLHSHQNQGNQNLHSEYFPAPQRLHATARSPPVSTSQSRSSSSDHDLQQHQPPTASCAKLPEQPPSYSAGLPPPGYSPSHALQPQGTKHPVYPPPHAYAPGAPVAQYHPQAGSGGNSAQVLRQPGYSFVQFGDSPVEFQCPYCNNRVTSNLDYKAGQSAWLCAGLLFILGFHLCAVIPLVMKDYKDIEHYCPVCNNMVSVYKRELF